MKKVLDLYDSFPITTSIKEGNKNFIFSDSGEVKSGTNLVCNVSASHSGTLINNRVYPPEKMRKGIKSWTTPFKKPVLVNHNEEGDPVGRVIKAKYIKTPRGMDGAEYKPVLKPSDGYGYIDLAVKITDQAAIQKILDGRYETVSVRMSTDQALCSVCGTDWADGPCEHMPGKKYDGKLAYMTTGDLTYREVSFVNIPADEFAKVEGATLEDKSDRDPVEVKLYANNAEEKFLCDMNDEKQSNLYDYLRDVYDEEEDILAHLIDKTMTRDSESKEDQMEKDKDLTKDQLIEMDAVKELIQEAKDSKGQECEDQLKQIKEECEKTSKDSASDSELQKQVDGSKEKLDAAIDAQTALSKEKDALSEERDTLKAELDKRDEERTTILDENVSLNSELHKLNAERLFDLKSGLNKPDVAGVKTIEDRDKKVEEFAQRSIESLKDQIGDLIIEKNDSPEAIKPAIEVENPGVEHEDSGAPEEKAKSKKESKIETLDRLFKQKENE